MAVTDIGTTFNLPNYTGELILLTPTDTPFITMAGVWAGDSYPNTGGFKLAQDVYFSWETESLPAASQPAYKQIDNSSGMIYGANTGTGVLEITTQTEARSINEGILQIFKYPVAVGYSKQSANQHLTYQAMTGANPSYAQEQPVMNEMDHQLKLALLRCKRDYEYCCLQGTSNKPANNTAVRAMGGIIPFISTNETAAGAVLLTQALFEDTLQDIWTQGGLKQAGKIIAFCNGFQKRRISYLYGFEPQSRNVGGVNITDIETDFGPVGVVLNRHMPAGTILIASMDEIVPRAMVTYGKNNEAKGILFTEDMPALDAFYLAMLYGELGCEFGAEQHHGKITGLATS